MKLYKSPFSKIVFSKKYGFLLFSGNTTTITKIRLSDFLNILFKKNNQIFLQKGILLTENYNNLILRAQSKGYKKSANNNIGITIAPTMNCNFKCGYCFVKNALKNQVMSKKLIDKIINFIASKGSRYTIEWFGGEPTLVPDLLEYFYTEAEKRSLIYDESILISNGTFEKENIWDVINNYITTIQITLDGPESIHDSRRMTINGSGSFNKIIRNLDILYKKILDGDIKNNLFVDIRCNLDRNNISSYQQIRNFILYRYNGMFCFTFAKVKNCGIRIYDKNILSDKEYSKFVLNQYHLFGIFREPILPLDRTIFQHCRVTNPNSYVFDPLGNIYKCDIDIGDENKIIGNCFDTKLPSNNTEAKYLFSASKFLPKKCNKCPLLFQCWGGCAHYRIENNMKNICKYQKFYFKKYIEFIYEINVLRHTNSKFIII